MADLAESEVVEVGDLDFDLDAPSRFQQEPVPLSDVCSYGKANRVARNRPALSGHPSL